MFHPALQTIVSIKAFFAKMAKQSMVKNKTAGKTFSYAYYNVAGYGSVDWLLPHAAPGLSKRE